MLNMPLYEAVSYVDSWLTVCLEFGESCDEDAESERGQCPDDGSDRNQFLVVFTFAAGRASHSH